MIGVIEREKIIARTELYIKEYYTCLLTPKEFKKAKNYDKFCECTYRRWIAKKILKHLKDPRNSKIPLIQILDELEVEYYEYMMIGSKVQFCVAYDMIVDVNDFIMDAIYNG